jgi:prepilin-type N-terminal cleavage/methylation domain-containing protein
MLPRTKARHPGLVRSARRGFTLVELLVVVTIIGILIALLLPAVQSAREAARRMQCCNHLKQMALAAHSHVNARGVFPTGGNVPWPVIEEYSTNGLPWGPAKQGLGWAFQILPYMELESLYGICVQAKIQQYEVGAYSCPSRRPPTHYPDSDQRVLMDYCGVISGDPPSITKDDSNTLYASFWQGDVWQVPGKKAWRCVIVRTDWKDGGGSAGSMPPISFNDITDGTSCTMMLGEKRLHPSNYQSGDWHDDRGWTDGWDPDTMRSSAYPLGPDIDENAIGVTGQQLDIAFCIGSAHSGAFNSAFADASVHPISYNIDRTIFAYLGTRDDGHAIETKDL